MMFGITDLSTYVLGTILIVLLPGPNSLYVLAVAAKSGTARGYLAACGIFVGDAVLMLASATGVASLLRANPAAFVAVKYAGAAYLTWIGIGVIRGAWLRWHGQTPGPAVAVAPQAPRKETAQPFRTALMISLVNPKAILFFISFFIQFVDPAYAHPVVTFLVLGVICQLISAAYLTLLILGGAHLAGAFRRRQRFAALGSGAVGALFIGFGVKLADATLN